MPRLMSEALGGDIYCVHRLDRAVGGVMVYARTTAAAAGLSRQIAARQFHKEYLGSYKEQILRREAAARRSQGCGA